MILKNTYGLTAVISSNKFKGARFNTFTGSSLNRAKTAPKRSQKKSSAGERKERTMSGRTKSKIRKKLFAFSRLYKRLSFLTLTFVNKVDDAKAVDVLRKFLDNVKKRSKNFQYLWVAERQTKNTVFPDNIHFHLITNKYWDIKKYWPYWLDLQKKNGIIPRDGSFKASSAFDVRALLSNNIKGLGNYLTKYVTKNKSKFQCQVWNCSKGISRLYTDFYSDYSFLEEANRMPDVKIKEIALQHCNLHIIPLNRTTVRLYDRLNHFNRH